MTDLMVILVLLAIVGGAGGYLYRAKRNGQKCVGCPYAKDCGKAACTCNARADK